MEIEAWLENKNKYKPHIFNIYVDNEKQSMVIENQALNAFINTFSSESFKLSLSTPTKRIKYKVPNHLREVDIIDISILPTEDFLLFNNKKLTPATESLIDEQVDIQHKNKLKFESINKLPIEVLNIGSCFSRSIFKTDEYFNPRYKEFFHIKKTL